MSRYVCERCDARVEPGAVVESRYPEWEHNGQMRDLCDDLIRDRDGDPLVEQPVRKYHRINVYHGAGGGMIGCHMTHALCGPLHEESAQEFFIASLGGAK